ncbi:MAG: hypothetical protein K9M99_06025 [Candidatus Cloacimonetes bacterium]|nr:hypothetical protein [Candidatus Cloacimonadota bacterium]
MKKNIFKQIRNIVRYKSEFILSRNPAVQIAMLAIVALFITMVATLVLKLTQIMPTEWKLLPLPKLVWNNLMRVMDQGTMVNDEGSWLFLLIMLTTTVFGLIIISTLIGIITEGFDSKVEELNKGRSAVIEKGHFIILGWSAKIYHIINQLIIGNILSDTGLGKPCIVILADKDKVEMEDAIYDNCRNSRKAKIICRSGNPIILEKLGKLSLDKADTILILASEKKNPDTFVFKIVLAIISLCSKKDKHKTTCKTVIAEIFEKKNEALLTDQINKCQMKNEINFIALNSSQIISEIIAQTCIQQKLSRVYSELLKFDKNDNEIYFEKVAKFRGINESDTFQDLMFKFENSCLIGYMKANSKDQDNKIVINPLSEQYGNEKLLPEDELIFIARQRKEIKFIVKHHDKQGKKTSPDIVRKQKLPISNTIIFGFNKKIFRIIDELENYINEGSSVKIIAKVTEENENEYKDYKESIKEKGERKQTLKLIKIAEQIIDQNIIEKEIFNITKDKDVKTAIRKKIKCDNIIILNYGNLNSHNANQEVAFLEEIDAITIKSLLNIRKYFELNKQFKEDGFSIVTEMKFAHNKDVIPSGDEDEFIISDEIISSIIAQTVLNKNLGKVYQDILLKSNKCEIYLKNAGCYAPLGTETTFNDLIRSGIEFNEIVIGYIFAKKGNPELEEDEIHLNPDRQLLVTFQKYDKVITIANDFTFYHPQSK